MVNKLVTEYSRKKYKIKKRLGEFRKFYTTKKDKEIFSELCFCILTPQSKAVFCDKAIRDLKKTGLLFKGTAASIRNKLKSVRFPNNKTIYLISARKTLSSKKGLDIKTKIDESDIFKTREWFVRNIKGLGYKEASHFLRNIGFGKDIAILDVHILRNLKRYRVIKDLPKNLSKSRYLSIEKKVYKFSKKMNIPMDELDLLFWSNETGIIFK